MAKPEQDREANARKSRVNELAGNLLGMDKKATKRLAEEVAKHLQEPRKIVITGASGANKTTVGRGLSIVLEIPAFDLDEYIPGGWVPDTQEYAKRFSEGMGNLWEDLPWANSWVIEHVEAAGPACRAMFRPAYAIYLNPGLDHLQEVAKARQVYGTYDKGVLERRLADTNLKSFSQFKSAPGEIIARGRGWELKKLNKEY